jgi:hypothetical protein
VKRNERERKATAQAGSQARRAVSIANFALLAGTTLGTLIGGFALDRLNLLYANAQGGSILLLRPHPLIWFFMAVPIALFLSILLYDPIVERFKGEPPPRLSVSYIFSSVKLPPFIRIGAIAIAGFFIVIALSNVPYHIRLTDSALFLCEPGDWTEHEWPFRAIKEISLAHYYDSGTKYIAAGPSTARALFLKHHNGKVWTPAYSILDAKPQVNYELARLVSHHAGVEVQFPDRVVGQPSEEARRNGERQVVILSLTLMLLPCGVIYALSRWKNRRHPHRSS